MTETDRFNRYVLLASISVIVIIAAISGWLTTRTASGDVPSHSHEAAMGVTAPPLPLPHPLADFQLMERSGQTVTRASLAGNFLVVNFIFTSCSQSCRAVNDRMAEIQRLLAGASGVQLLSLSLDPQTDTPAVLTKFADSYNADPHRWLFLTGDKADLYGLIENSFIPRSPDLAQLIPGGFADTDRIMLVDQQANVCASFNGSNPQVAAKVVAEIEKRRKDHMLP